jgi:site-specific recombinase XerD
MAHLRECIAKYLAELERRGASKHTLRSYASDLAQFATYFEPPGEQAPPVEQIEQPLLREWLAWLLDGRQGGRLGSNSAARQGG